MIAEIDAAWHSFKTTVQLALAGVESERRLALGHATVELNEKLLAIQAAHLDVIARRPPAGDKDIHGKG